MKFENPSRYEGLMDAWELAPGVFREILSPPQLREASELPPKTDLILGTPQEDAERWHRQTRGFSCELSCEEFIAEGLLGGAFSEKRMIDYAAELGIYSENRGVQAADTGRLLEKMGLEVTREYGCTVKDLRQVLEQGGKIMAGVNGPALRYPDYALRPGTRANHMVQVIGIDDTVPGGSQIILNDPAPQNGAGLRVPMDRYLRAWNTSGNFMVSVFR